MLAAENTHIVRRLYEELINQENPAVVDELFAPDVITHDTLQGELHGRDAFKQLVDTFNRAFPGHRVELHGMYADGDYVTVLHTHFGQHSGRCPSSRASRASRR